MAVGNESNSDIEVIEWLPGLQLAACIFYSIILLVGVTGNILVIVIVMKYREMRNATNLLLMNLSVADLFLLVFCIADGYQHLYGKDKHRLGRFMCKFSPFVQNTTAICSVLTIMAISYERYVAICQPLKVTTLRLTVFRTIPTVIIVWFISCFVSIPFFKFTDTGLADATYNETIITCFTKFPLFWSTYYLISCTLLVYIVILIMLCYWHYSICHILFNREALLRDNTIVTRYRRQVAQLLIALIITFFILILPYKIWAIIHQHMTYEQFLQIGFHRYSLISTITRSLVYLNSAINPLLYSILSTKFRQSFLRLFNRCHTSSKIQRTSAALFCRGHLKRPISLNVQRGDTISSNGKLQYHPSNIHQLQERKLLLVDNTPTPVTVNTIDTSKFIFP